MSSLNKRFDTFFKKIVQLIDKFALLRTKIATFHKNCNIAKALGTACSVAGTIAIIFASGGTGVVVGSSTGLIAGFITNLIVNAIDEDETKKFLNDIKKLMDDFAIEMASMEPVLNYIARVLEKHEEEASVLDGTKAKIDKTFHHAQNITIQQLTTSSLEKLVNMKSKNFPKLIAAIKGEGGPAVAAIEKIFEMLPKMEEFFSKAASIEKFEMISGCAVYLQAFIQLAEVIVLVRSCLSEHVTVEMIDDIVPKLETIQNEYESILRQLQKMPSTSKTIVTKIGFEVYE